MSNVNVPVTDSVHNSYEKTFGGGRTPLRRHLLAIALTFTTSAAVHSAEPTPPHCIKVTGRAALLHLGSLDSFDRTEAGTTAAKLVNEAITNEKRRVAAAREAIAVYNDIIPSENFGGEYTALQWICEYLSSDPEAQKKLLDNPQTEGFYRYWSENNFANLKTYLKFKYKFDGQTPKTFDEAELHRFQEDFILFANPRRERWERTSEFIKAIGLKEGQTVADIGCGPGYFTFQFAKQVGAKGKIYSIDTNDRHIAYVTEMAKKIGADNVIPRKPSQKENDVGIPRDVQVDCVFLCSLYHIVYTSFTDEERQKFLEAIKKGLKPNGRLILVDNGPVDLVDGKRLPYHGPFIAKELLVAQLEHFGFRLKESHQIIKQRYLLFFELAGNAPAPKLQAKADSCEGGILVTSASSLVQHHRVGNPFVFTQKGRATAKIFFKALDKKDKKAAEEALKEYRDLSKEERIGCEYTAFMWVCDYLLAEPDQRKKMIEDPVVFEYFTTLGGDDFTMLKKFVRAYYVLDTPDEDIDDPKKVKVPEETFDQIFEWMETIIFNNPRRPAWEKTEETLKLLDLKPGQTIADIGCGSGFYTFKFSKAVGPSGKVYATETNEDALKAFKATADRLKMNNIETIKATYDNCHLPEASADMIFLCSLYEAAYVTSIDFVQERFIDSIKKSLKKGGRLVVIDNEINTGKEPPYFGPRIDRRLIIEQLRHSGFKLTKSAQFIPQRYILVFQAE